MQYADVIVDISLQNLDRIFQYKIPDHLKGKVATGTSVVVPFGKGDRVVKGFVVGLCEEPDYDIEKIKNIISVEENTAVIESKLLILAKYIRDNFGGTTNEALKTVLPVKKLMKNLENETIFLNVSKEELDSLIVKHKNAKARLRFLNAFAENESIDTKTLREKYSITKNIVEYFCENGVCTKERQVVFRNPVKDRNREDNKHCLNDEQKQVVDQISIQYQQGIRNNYLIHGVTGSGKTECYMSIIEKVIDMGQQVIVLIPEIALTYQTVTRFYNRFGDRVSIINSRLTDGERSDQYKRAKNGEIDIMIGPRSALFTPFQKLGMIIVDEEHERSYKSDSVPKYHAVDVAIERGKLENASVILGSATPSVNSYMKAQMGIYKLFTLKERAGNAKLPNVEVVDLREELKNGNKSIFSIKLKELIQDRLDKREQVMLFINRRGFSGFVSCRSCGHVIKCPHCDISLTYHSYNDRNDYNGKGTMKCHYCGYSEEAVSTCKECGSPFISTFGTGTQKLEFLINKEFPQAKVLRMDGDTTKSKDDHEKILASFNNQEADILIGTQMIVKGHDFKNVTLMGIIAADLSLNEGNYMAAEDTFDLLVQACGRAGRGEKSGDVVIQTYNPTHYSVVEAACNNYEGFYEKEISFRRAMRYPPASNLMVALCMSKDEGSEKAFATLLCKAMREFIKNGDSTCENLRKTSIIGPVPASVAKINDIFRDVVYIKNADYEVLALLRRMIESYHDKYKERGYYKNVTLHFDFNPIRGY